MSTRSLNRKEGSQPTEGEAACNARLVDKPRSATRALPAASVHRGAGKGRCAYRSTSGSAATVHWEALSQAYQRLTQAFLAQPAVPPVDELDAFSALAIRSHLSSHELVALHYATLNQLLAGDERYADESSSAARRALVSVLLRLMGEYRRSGGDVAPGSAVDQQPRQQPEVV
jgi:hypothetical protein